MTQLLKILRMQLMCLTMVTMVTASAEMLLTAMLMLVTADGKGIGDSGPRLLQGLLRARLSE